MIGSKKSCLFLSALETLPSVDTDKLKSTNGAVPFHEHILCSSLSSYLFTAAIRNVEKQVHEIARHRSLDLTTNDTAASLFREANRQRICCDTHTTARTSLSKFLASHRRDTSGAGTLRVCTFSEQLTAGFSLEPRQMVLSNDRSSGQHRSLRALHNCDRSLLNAQADRTTTPEEPA